MPDIKNIFPFDLGDSCTFGLMVLIDWDIGRTNDIAGGDGVLTGVCGRDCSCCGIVGTGKSCPSILSIQHIIYKVITLCKLYE